jgi:glycosyltransferase involved in cell wall biosynthesis
MQKTNFPFEIVIGEDCSTDGTRKIVFDYQNKFPDLIKVITSEANVGPQANIVRTLKACKGKYIAILEGDDYWTDPYKLQKQVDFLEANPDYGLVSSDINLIDVEGNPLPDNNMVLKQREKRKPEVDFFDLLGTNLINTLTVCARADIMKELAERVLNENLWFVYDYWFWLHVARQTKIKILEDKTAAYRIHSGGASQKKDFFHKRIPLVRANALQYFLQQHPYKKLTSEEKALVGKVFWKTIFSKTLNIYEKKVLWNIIYTSPRILYSLLHLVQG